MSFSNITFDLPKNKSASIKVIGVGGGGSNAVNYMFEQGITGVDFVVANTDAQALYNSPVPNKVQLGVSITEGLGAGANPEVGEQAALESIDDIKSLLDTNTKMLFITAGMGGGTGTGAAPIIANIAKEMGILTVGICTAPFYFEGKMRLAQAVKGIEKFRNNVDSLIIINNDKLRELYGNLGYKTGFAKADEVLATAAKGIAEVITHHYATNIDLRDAKTVLADSGTAIMGSATAEGDNKAKKAIEAALDSPLLNDNKITGAKNVLLLIVSGNDEVTMDEIGTINDYIQQEAGNGANIIMGIGEDENLGDSMSVTVIATGFPVDQHGINGKEEEPIVHKLEEEKPLSQVFSVSKTKESVAPVVEEKVINTLEEPLNKEGNKEEVIKFELKTEENVEPVQEVRQEPVANEITFEVNEPVQEPQLKVEPIQEPKTSTKEVQTQSAPKPQADAELTLFTLEDDWTNDSETPISINNVTETAEAKVEETVVIEEVVDVIEPIVEQDIPEVLNETPEEEIVFETKIQEEVVEEQIKTSVNESPFDTPISANVDRQIRERRERLKKFNFKFKNTLNETDFDEAERIPAYKRNNVELSEHRREKPGNYILDKDTSNDLKIRPNNFLHDNVD